MLRPLLFRISRVPRVAPPRKFLHKFASLQPQQLQGLLPSLTPKDLAVALFHLSKKGGKPDKEIFTSLQPSLSELETEGIFQLFFVCRKFQVEDPFWEALCVRALTCHFTPNDCSAVLGSIAHKFGRKKFLHEYEVKLVQYLSDQVRVRSVALDAQSVANSLNALAKLDVFEEAVVSELCRAAKREIAVFKPQEIANILNALARFRVCDDELVTLLINEAKNKAVEFNPQEIACMLAALEKLEIYDKALVTQLTEEGKSRATSLVTDLKLPQSETEFMQLMSTKNSKERQRVAAGLAHAHRDDPRLTSLLRELLHTEVCCEKIPIKNPVPDDQSQNSDRAVVDSEMVPLIFPQSNASVKFMQRELAISMALVAGTQMDLMLEVARHPSMAGKAAVLGYLAKAATDDDLVVLYAKCVPGVQETLWNQLEYNGRKAACKRIRPSHCDTVEPDFTLEEFAATLEACAMRERAAKWDKISDTAEYKQLVKQSWKEVAQADSPMQPVLKRLFELAEKYSPLRNTAPMLHPKLCNILHYLLRSDCERTMKLVQETTFDMTTGPNPQPTFNIPTKFFSRKGSKKFCGRYWRTEGDQRELLPFFEQILNFDNRRLVLEGHMNGKWEEMLFWLHRSILEQLAQRGLELVEIAQSRAKLTNKPTELRNAVQFVVDIMNTLADRLYAIASKPACEDAQPLFEDLLGQILDQLIKALGNQPDLVYAMVLRPCSSLFESYPPLAERFFNLCLSHNVFVRDGQIVASAREICWQVLPLLAPSTHATDIFNFPNDALEPEFWRVPAWSNEAAFDFLCRDFRVEFYSTYCDLAPSLTTQQRAKLFSMFPIATLMQDFREHRYQLSQLLECLAPNAQAKHEVAWAARDVEDKRALRAMQQFWDITIPAVRELLQSNVNKRTYAERSEEMQVLLNVTKNSNSIAELITTLAFVFARVKHDIMPDQNDFASVLYALTPTFYVNTRATREEAQQLAKLFLSFDTDLLAGVSVSKGAVGFTKVLAVTAISRFAGQPDHPFFQFGCELLWRRAVNTLGLAPAARQWSLEVKEFFVKDAEQERERRVAVAAERKSLEERGVGIGNKRIPPGAEVKFVTEALRQYAQRWEQAGMAAEAPADLARAQSLILLLGGRWENSPQLVAAVEQQLHVLANAPRNEKHKEGEETVPLCWCQDPPAIAAKAFMMTVSGLYPRKNLQGHSWWQKFRDLRLQSCDALTEARYRYLQCKDEAGKIDVAKAEAVVRSLLQISLSALHLDFVARFVMAYRQDWVTAEMLTATKFRGLFHASDNELVLDTETPSDLFPWQCELLAKKYLACAHSVQVRLEDRVRAVEKYTRLPTTTVEELSAFLVTPSLPQRLEEAVLMFLPKLNEPATGIQLLLAPVYLSSDVARTAIHAAKGSLAYIPQDMLGRLLESLFPPESKDMKVNVFKELVRLTAAHIAIPSCQQLLMRLWRRPKLHVDVRVVFVQMAIKLIGNHDENVRELGWTIIQDATAADYRGTAVALALVRVRAERTQENLMDCDRPSQPYYWESKANTNYSARAIPELEDLVWQTLQPAQCQRYLDTALLPLCEPPKGVKYSTRVNKDVPLYAYLQMANFLTPDNAEAMAQRLAASEVPEGSFNVVAYLLGVCVGLCPQPGPKKPWGQFQKVLARLARVLADRSQPPATRLHAKESIFELQLHDRYIFPKIESAALDRMLVEATLRSQGMSDWYWKELFQRKVAVTALGWTFVPSTHAAEVEHKTRVAREALRLVLELADKCARWELTGQFFSDQIVDIFDLVKIAQRELQVALLNNLTSVAPRLRTALHLQLLALSCTTQADRLSILPLVQSEVEHASSRLSQREVISSPSWHTLQPTFVRELAEIVDGKNADSITAMLREPDVITPLSLQAMAEGWRGPASQLLWGLTLRSPVAVFARLPTTICQFIATSVELGREKYVQVLDSLVQFVARATVEFSQNESPSDSLLLGPYTASLIEMISKGHLHCLDLSEFLRPNGLKGVTARGADLFAYSMLVVDGQAPVITSPRPARIADLPVPRAVPYRACFVPRMGDVWCKAGLELLDLNHLVGVVHPLLYCDLILQSLRRGLMEEVKLVELAHRVMKSCVKKENGRSTRTAEGKLRSWKWAPSPLLALETVRMFLPKNVAAEDRLHFLRCTAAVSMLETIADACDNRFNEVWPEDNKEAMGKLWDELVKDLDAQQCPRFQRDALTLAALRRVFE